MTFTIFKCLLYIFSEKAKDLESWHNFLLSNCSRLLNWKGPGTLLQFSKLLKKFLKIIHLDYIYQLIYSKMHPASCNNTHHDVTDLVNHGMIENTKTWICWERNITFLRNKKILNLSIVWHILRGYRFVAEITFNH